MEDTFFEVECESQLWQFNFYLGLVGQERGIKEIRTNRSRMDSKELDILYCIHNGNIDYLKSLHEAGHKINAYKDIQYLLAVKFNHIEIAEYLYQTKNYNINTPSLNGLMHIIAEHGSEEMFNYFFNKYETQFHNIDIEIKTERDLYESQKYVDITSIFITALMYNNMDIVYCIQYNHKIFDKIDFDYIKKDIESPFFVEYFQKGLKRIIRWMDNNLKKYVF